METLSAVATKQNRFFLLSKGLFTSQSRIDFFLISKVLFTSQEVVKMDIDPGVRSDHSVIVLEIFVKGSRRGPGLWRFNNTLLEVKDLTDRIRSEIESANTFEGEYCCVTDPGVLLNVLLCRIRALCIRQSIAMAREKRHAEKRLEDEYKLLEELLGEGSGSDTLLEKFTDIKRELEDYKSEAAKRAMLFSRTKWLEQGERPTKYFLNLERRNVRDKMINVLEREDGKLVTEDREILAFCKDFYEELHRSKNLPTDQTSYDNIQTPVLDERDKQLCNGYITNEECLIALKSMGANKCPSASGFNKEFMLFFLGRHW